MLTPGLSFGADPTAPVGGWLGPWSFSLRSSECEPLDTSRIPQIQIWVRVHTHEMGPRDQMQSGGCSHLARYFGDRCSCGAGQQQERPPASLRGWLRALRADTNLTFLGRATPVLTAAAAVVQDSLHGALSR